MASANSCRYLFIKPSVGKKAIHSVVNSFKKIKVKKPSFFRHLFLSTEINFFKFESLEVKSLEDFLAKEKVQAILKDTNISSAEKLNQLSNEYAQYSLKNAEPILLQIEGVLNGSKNTTPGLKKTSQTINRLLRVNSNMNFSGSEKNLPESSSFKEVARIFQISQAAAREAEGHRFFNSHLLTTKLINDSLFFPVLGVNTAKMNTKPILKQSISTTVELMKSSPKEQLEKILSDLEVKISQLDINIHQQNMYKFLQQITKDAIKGSEVKIQNYNGLFLGPRPGFLLIRGLVIANFIHHLSMAMTDPTYTRMPFPYSVDLNAIYYILTLF